MYKTTNIGLDLHACSIHTANLNATTGELSQQKLTDTDDHAVLAYLRNFVTDREAAHVVYEAGPTGYHLARCLNAAGGDDGCLTHSPRFVTSTDCANSSVYRRRPAKLL